MLKDFVLCDFLFASTLKDAQFHRIEESIELIETKEFIFSLYG